jgi:hypothetical protein
MGKSWLFLRRVEQCNFGLLSGNVTPVKDGPLFDGYITEMAFEEKT